MKQLYSWETDVYIWYYALLVV